MSKTPTVKEVDANILWKSIGGSAHHKGVLQLGVDADGSIQLVRADAEGKTEIASTAIESILCQILHQLEIMNMHLSSLD